MVYCLRNELVPKLCGFVLYLKRERGGRGGGDRKIKIDEKKVQREVVAKEIVLRFL